MDIRSLDNSAEQHGVLPARDAERSEHSIYDHVRGAPQGSRQRQHRARAPIGVFDSGAGGLTILTALQQELPNEHFIYLGDTANCPYGTRSEEEIIELSLRNSRYLIDQGVKLIVVACNTASQASLSVLRSTFSIPFIGVVPAVKPAARLTRRGRIGIAATNQAVKASYLRHLIDDFASDIQVYAVGCPQLVTLVEQGELGGPHVESVLRDALQPLIDKEIDVLVLGCTHFPALRPAIAQVMGKQVQIIDSGSAIARRAHAILDTDGLARPLNGLEGSTSIWCSGDAEEFSRVASTVLGYPVQARRSTFELADQ
ncbi:glutamate racemase [Dictyobacter aurantiacus]|uniref:Glutamate racemase n=1 Tax=Dictyobacter aurantiacus TaxID=1936993 RepID=A0A401ZF45_9CHLR|nr:glutamate racemase [Dictyobacter aurantiacus]GCE05466.1 glutamate racemase [Dictyobacter aurantiacus]